MVRLRIKNPKQQLEDTEDGFTIIELLFATAIFALVLLGCTAGLIQVGRMYFKGVTNSTTQETARTIMDDIARPIQFSGDTPIIVPANPPATTVSVFCIGTERYSYVVDRQLNDNPSSDITLKQSKHVLWRDTMKSAGTCKALDVSSDHPSDDLSNNDGQEMLAPNMRLSRFAITPISETDSRPRLFEVAVWVVYGDQDLLYLNNMDGVDHLVCNGGFVGTQFCAVSELTTIVDRRLK